MHSRSARRALVLALSGALAIGAVGCAKSERNNNASGGSAKDTLVFGAAGEPKLFDPAFASDGETFRVVRQVFDGLVVPKEGSAEIEPALATSWTSSPEGKTWTFNLREGVKFTDGTDFNADAVCFNFERWYHFSGALQNPDVSAYWQDTFGGFAKNESKDTPASLYKSCTASDPKTVAIELTSSTGRFPAALSLPSFSIQSPAALKKYNADAVKQSGDTFEYPEYATAHPTGSGPYKLDRIDQATKTVTLVRNDDYWGAKAKIRKLVFKVVPDNNTRKQELQAGTIDGYDLVAPGDIQALKDAGLTVLDRPAFNILYLGINQKNPALAKPEVRQALAYAINREALVKAKFPPAAQVAKEFIPPTVLGYADDVKTYEYDVNKAKQLLAQAGATNLNLKFYYPTEVSRPYMPNPKEIFEVVKSDLQKAGIKITAVPRVWNSGYLTDTANGKSDIHLLGWTGDYNDTYNFVGTFFGYPKLQFGFNNPALFEAIKKADAEPDQAKREGLYKAVNRQIMEFLPAVPISHSPPSLAFKSAIEGITPSPVTNEDFSKAYFKG